mmetsp:Transcript_3032/g.9101  ORF Transcript_3032/g.9101 Transcript_3032/m.9101 type:complete len:208 (-) Transcript_3032:692-1315(-)|eukprot:1795776-Prymnesium_polylepis.1
MLFCIVRHAAFTSGAYNRRTNSVSLSPLTARDGTCEPTLRFCSRSPQKGLSHTNETMQLGMPARSAAARVPGPPWWTAIEQSSNSDECGTGRSSRKAPSGTDEMQWRNSGVTCRMARHCRLRMHARAESQARCAKSSLDMEPGPKPKKTGAWPARQKSTRSAGRGGKPPVRSTLPQTTIFSCQSSGLGRSEGDHTQKHGSRIFMMSS